MEAADLVLGYRRLSNVDDDDNDNVVDDDDDDDNDNDNIDDDNLDDDDLDDDDVDVDVDVDDDDGHYDYGVVYDDDDDRTMYPTISNHPFSHLCIYYIIIIIIFKVNKADGLLLESARHTVADYQAGMTFIRRKYQQWFPPVISISAYKQINIDIVLQTITLFYTTLTNINNKYDHDNHDEIERKRQRQWKHMLLATFRRNLISEIESNKDIKQYLNSYVNDMIYDDNNYTTTIDDDDDDDENIDFNSSSTTNDGNTSSRNRNYKRRISPRAAADNIVKYIINKLEQR